MSTSKKQSREILIILTSQENKFNFATSKIKKKIIQPSTFYLWVYMLRDPMFRLADPKFCGKFESELRSGFRARNGELKGSGVLGMEGDNSPFRGARPKLISYSNSPYPNPHSTQFLVPAGIFGRIFRTEQYSGPGRGCCSGRKPVRFGKSPQKSPRVPRNVWRGVSGTRNPNMKLVLV